MRWCSASMTVAASSPSSAVKRVKPERSVKTIARSVGVVESDFVSLFHDSIWMALSPIAARADGLRSTDRSRKRCTTSNVVVVDSG